MENFHNPHYPNHEPQYTPKSYHPVIQQHYQAKSTSNKILYKGMNRKQLEAYATFLEQKIAHCNTPPHRTPTPYTQPQGGFTPTPYTPTSGGFTPIPLNPYSGTPQKTYGNAVKIGAFGRPVGVSASGVPDPFYAYKEGIQQYDEDGGKGDFGIPEKSSLLCSFKTIIVDPENPFFSTGFGYGDPFIPIGDVPKDISLWTGGNYHNIWLGKPKPIGKFITFKASFNNPLNLSKILNVLKKGNKVKIVYMDCGFEKWILGVYPIPTPKKPDPPPVTFEQGETRLKAFGGKVHPLEEPLADAEVIYDQKEVKIILDGTLRNMGNTRILSASRKIEGEWFLIRPNTKGPGFELVFIRKAESDEFPVEGGDD